MFAKERQKKIYELLKSGGAVLTSELVERFSTSTETIRRDLLAMEHEGLLLRVHGGAMLQNGMQSPMELKERHEEHHAGKRALAKKALDFIEEGDIIAIDEGSTAIFLSEAIRERFTKLTVITHSLDVFSILANHKEISVILCGGFYLRSERAFYGEPTLGMLRGLHAKKAFLFPGAISLEHGICCYENNLLQVQKQMAASADSVFILADSSKFEKTSLIKLDDMSPRFSYITDPGLPETLKNLYRENGIQVYIGESKS